MTEGSGIKIKYAAFNDMRFVQAVQKIMSTNTDGHTAYRLAKLFKAVKEGTEKMEGVREETLLKKYAVKDKDGKEVTPRTMPKQGENAEFEKAVDTFLNETMVLGTTDSLTKTFKPTAKLTARDIRDAKLTGNEMEAIEVLLDEASFNEEEATAPQKMMRVK